MALSNRKTRAWKNAPYCKMCVDNGDYNPNQERWCFLCGGFINKGNYCTDEQKTTNCWNIHHIDGNKKNNNWNNLTAVHRDCNIDSGNNDTTSKYKNCDYDCGEH